MKMIMLAGCLTALLASAAVSVGDDEIPMPKPQKEHAWLQQLAGEWEYETELKMDPAQPAVKTKGTESGRMVGSFWVVLDNRGEFQGQPFQGIFTVGYDTEEKAYVGTWIDSMTGYMWQHRGTLDPTGKILTMNTEGPCPELGGKIAKMRDTLELKSKDEKVLTSAKEVDGKWVNHMTIHYKRK